MALKAVQLQLEVPEIPESHSLVSRASGEDELRVRVETKTVHLGEHM